MVKVQISRAGTETDLSWEEELEAQRFASQRLRGRGAAVSWTGWQQKARARFLVSSAAQRAKALGMFEAKYFKTGGGATESISAQEYNLIQSGKAGEVFITGESGLRYGMSVEPSQQEAFAKEQIMSGAAKVETPTTIYSREVVPQQGFTPVPDVPTPSGDQIPQEQIQQLGILPPLPSITETKEFIMDIPERTRETLIGAREFVSDLDLPLSPIAQETLIKTRETQVGARKIPKFVGGLGADFFGITERREQELAIKEFESLTPEEALIKAKAGEEGYTFKTTEGGELVSFVPPKGETRLERLDIKMRNFIFPDVTREDIKIASKFTAGQTIFAGTKYEKFVDPFKLQRQQFREGMLLEGIEKPATTLIGGGIGFAGGFIFKGIGLGVKTSSFLIGGTKVFLRAQKGMKIASISGGAVLGATEVGGVTTEAILSEEPIETTLGREMVSGSSIVAGFGAGEKFFTKLTPKSFLTRKGGFIPSEGSELTKLVKKDNFLETEVMGLRGEGAGKIKQFMTPEDISKIETFQRYELLKKTKRFEDPSSTFSKSLEIGIEKDLRVTDVFTGKQIESLSKEISQIEGVSLKDAELKVLKSSVFSKEVKTSLSDVTGLSPIKQQVYGLRLGTLDKGISENVALTFRLGSRGKPVDIGLVTGRFEDKEGLITGFKKARFVKGEPFPRFKIEDIYSVQSEKFGEDLKFELRKLPSEKLDIQRKEGLLTKEEALNIGLPKFSKKELASIFEKAGPLRSAGGGTIITKKIPIEGYSFGDISILNKPSKRLFVTKGVEQPDIGFNINLDFNFPKRYSRGSVKDMISNLPEKQKKRVIDNRKFFKNIGGEDLKDLELRRIEDLPKMVGGGGKGVSGGFQQPISPKLANILAEETLVGAIKPPMRKPSTGLINLGFGKLKINNFGFKPFFTPKTDFQGNGDIFKVDRLFATPSGMREENLLLVKQDIKNLQIPKTNFVQLYGLNQDVGVLPLQGMGLTSAQKLSVRQIAETSGGKGLDFVPFDFGRFSFRRLTMKTRFTPFLPIGLPSGLLLEKPQKRKVKKRKFKRTPSLIALPSELDIFAGKPVKGEISGLVVRPVVN